MTINAYLTIAMFMSLAIMINATSQSGDRLSSMVCNQRQADHFDSDGAYVASISGSYQCSRGDEEAICDLQADSQLESNASDDDTDEWMRLMEEDLDENKQSSPQSAFTTRKQSEGFSQPVPDQNTSTSEWIYPTCRRLIEPGFPNRGRQADYLKEDVDRIYARLSDTWPRHFSPEIISYQARYASRFLRKHPDFIQALIDNDDMTWDIFIRTMEIKPKLKKNKYTGNRKGPNHKVDLTWLAEPMVHFQKERIIERLSEYWNGADRKLVNARLLRYAGMFGAITSPGPLLEDDEEVFEKAANTIFCENDGKSQRHSKMDKKDSLHQGHQTIVGEGSSSHTITRKSRFMRLDAARFTSGQEWMKSRTPSEIAAVHDAIRAHLIDKLSKPTLHSIFIKANEMLEGNERLLDRIEAKEEYAAWYVASNCVKRQSQLKVPA